MNYYLNQCERYKRDSKKLWHTINGICGKSNDTSSCIPYLSINGINQYNANAISNNFATHFTNVGKMLSEKTPISANSIESYLKKIPHNEKSLFLQPCNIYEIKRILISLTNKKSSGYDGISNITIKKLSDSISSPLSIIFNRSLIDGEFPEMMKLADIIPLHKGGNPHLLDNYRPVSLLITLFKILEKIMYSRVYNFLDTTGQIFNSQYGF